VGWNERGGVESLFIAPPPERNSQRLVG
jgi:hypothetical protein